MEETSNPQKEKIICSKCKVNTNHRKIWKSQVEKWNDEETEIWAQSYWELLECLGCETPTLKHFSLFSEDMGIIGVDKDTKESIWDIIPKITYFPPRGKEIKEIRNFFDIPPKVIKVYTETITAFNNSLPLLCAIGIRATIEAVCNEEMIEGSDLKDKIKKLKDKGIISDKLCNALQASRLTGNASAHKLTLFSNNILLAGIELLESMLDFHYNSSLREKILKSELNEEEIKLQKDL